MRDDRARAWTLFLVLFAGLLLASEPAWAGSKKEDAQFMVFSMTLLPLALYPIGLALHLFIASIAPMRSEGLSLDLQDHYWKTLLLGICNFAALAILMGVFSKRAPGLAGLCATGVFLLGVLGIHGITRATGEWVLEHTFRSGPSVSPVKAIAIGWFVCLYLACIPIIGWILALFWVVRGIGGVVLQVAGSRNSEDLPLDKLDL